MVEAPGELLAQGEWYPDQQPHERVHHRQYATLLQLQAGYASMPGELCLPVQ